MKQKMLHLLNSIKLTTMIFLATKPNRIGAVEIQPHKLFFKPTHGTMAMVVFGTIGMYLIFSLEMKNQNTT